MSFFKTNDDIPTCTNGRKNKHGEAKEKLKDGGKSCAESCESDGTITMLDKGQETKGGW